MKDILKGDEQFRYRMLARMQADCEYYLGYGLRNKNRLWSHDEKEQIQNMFDLYNSLSVKPEWCTLKQIQGYSSLMCDPNKVFIYDVNYIKYDKKKNRYEFICTEIHGGRLRYQVKHSFNAKRFDDMMKKKYYRK